MKKNSIVEIVYETLMSLNFKKEGNILLFYNDQENEETHRNEINELKMSSYSFNRKLFEENVTDGFFDEGNEKRNIEDFIKFDL